MVLAGTVRQVVSETPAPGDLPVLADGPYDAGLVPSDGHHRLDVGSLLIAAPRGQQVRLAVDEQTRQVHAVHVVAGEGAAEVRAYAAPRNGSRWETARTELAAQAADQGVVFQERSGPFGVELIHPGSGSGETAVPPTRVIGVDGPRWLLRVTLLGQPAVEPDRSLEWEEFVSLIAVRRGDAPMPVGAPLPFALPAEAPTPN